MSLSVNSHQPIKQYSIFPPIAIQPAFTIEAHASTLALWEQAGFCDAEGRLAFYPDIQPEPLRLQAREKFNALLRKMVTIGKKQVSFKDYLEKVQEVFPRHQLFLRGSYASYVIEPLQELKALIDAFITQYPPTAEIMQEGYNRLIASIQPQEEPLDADWALISDIETLPEDLGAIKGKLVLVNAALGDLDFLTAKNTTFVNLNPARKNNLTLTEDPIVIASLKGSLDLLVGSPQISPCLFSYDNRYIPFDHEKPPMALRGDYWQSTLDHALGIIRLEPRHKLDFRALLIAIKHLSQGKTWILSDFDFAEAFNHFAENASPDQLFSVIESKIPKDSPSSICYLMNVLSLIERNETLWRRFYPLIAQHLSIPLELEFSYSQLANELQGFDRMPFLKKSTAPTHPDLALFLKKNLLLYPERLPTPPQEGPYADWAIDISALHQKNPLLQTPLSIYEVLFSLVQKNALSEEERETLQTTWGWNESLETTHLLDRLIAIGNLKTFLPLWLNAHHQGNWEKTLKRLLEVVKLKTRKERIKSYFERTLCSQSDPHELFLASFSQHLFQPDAIAKQLMKDSLHFDDEEKLAQFLQSLAPHVRQKNWLTDLWIDFHVAGSISAEYLRKRIVIWFASNLSHEQKNGLARDLIQRCRIDLFDNESAAHITNHLQDMMDRERWLHTLLATWPIDRFLRFIEMIGETEISSKLLRTELKKRLQENSLIAFIDLFTQEPFFKRVKISSGELEIPLKEALLELSRAPKEQEIFIKHALSLDHTKLPVVLIRSLFKQLMSEPGLYLEELKAHQNWLIDQFKEDGEQLHKLFLFFHAQNISATPPKSLLVFLSHQTSNPIDLKLSLSLMGLKGGESLYMPVLRGILQSPASPFFKDWLFQAFPRLKGPERLEILSLLNGRRSELCTLFEYLIERSIKNPQPFADKLLDALLEIPEILETIDFKCIKKLLGHSGKPLQRFFASPELFTRFVNEYLFLKPVNQELLQLSIHQAETFNLLHLFIGEAPLLRKLLNLKEDSHIALRRIGVESYLFQATGSHEWLYEMPGMCDHPIVNQIAIIRLVNEGIDFYQDPEARAFLLQRINDIILLRQQQGIAWINYPTIGECLSEIFNSPLIESEKNLPEGLFEWFHAIGMDPLQTISCRSQMLQIAVLHGPSQISENALLHLFDLLPEISDINFHLMEGLIFATSINPHLSTKPLRDKLRQLLEQESSANFHRMTVLYRLLDLILLNRIKEHEEERLNCCLSLFRAAVEAKIDLLQPSYAHQIIKCICLNFFTAHGKALLIKDEWVKASISIHPHTPPNEIKLKCLSLLNEQIFNHVTENSFSGILVLVAQELTSIIHALKGGYAKTSPILEKLLEKSTANPFFTHSTIQLETLIPLLPHLKNPSLIYFYLLILMRKNLEMPPGDYLKYLNIHDEINLIHHSLDVYQLQGNEVAAEAAKRIYLFSLKKKMNFTNRLKCFEKVIQTYSKAQKGLDSCLDVAVETFRRLEKPLNEDQRRLFIQVIERNRVNPQTN